MKKMTGLLFAVLAMTGGMAKASLITFTTAPGATMNGQPINAQATFTTSPGHVAIVLENLQADPTSATQNMRGVFFTLSTGQTVGSLASSVCNLRTVNANGTYTDSAASGTGWVLTSGGTGLQLDLTGLGGPEWPAHTIIGPPSNANLYAQGNGSITGNSHNPFIAGAASFDLNVPGVTANTTITAVTFSFNTTAGDDTPGTPTPEPGTVALLVLGGIVSGIKRRS